MEKLTGKASRRRWTLSFFYLFLLIFTVKVKLLSHARLFATPWTVAYQAPPSMGFSRQEYWSGVPLPSPGDLPDPGIEPGSPTLQADALPSEPPGVTLIFKVTFILFLKILIYSLKLKYSLFTMLC